MDTVERADGERDVSGREGRRRIPAWSTGQFEVGSRLHGKGAMSKRVHWIGAAGIDHGLLGQVNGASHDRDVLAEIHQVAVDRQTIDVQRQLPRACRPYPGCIT